MRAAEIEITVDCVIYVRSELSNPLLRDTTNWLKTDQARLLLSPMTAGPGPPLKGFMQAETPCTGTVRCSDGTSSRWQGGVIRRRRISMNLFTGKEGRKHDDAIRFQANFARDFRHI
jgi:hypothetical protein